MTTILCDRGHEPIQFSITLDRCPLCEQIALLSEAIESYKERIEDLRNDIATLRHLLGAELGKPKV